MEEIKDPIIKEMVESGKMAESQIPFDKSKNEFKKSDKEKESKKLPVIYKLKEPIKFMDREIKEVTFKRLPKAETILHLPLGGEYQMGHFLPIIASMTGELEGVIEEITSKDYFHMVGIVTDFLF